MKGGDDHRLIGAGIDLERAQHGLVESHRRVGVDQLDHHAVVRDEVLAEDQARHGDAVLGALGCRDRAHEGQVGVAQVAVDHVEVALVHRHVDRLADRAARVVQVGQHVGQLHDVPEVLDRGVAPAPVQGTHEGGAIDRHEDRVVAADGHRASRIAGVLGEARLRALLNDAAAKPLRTAHPLALDVGAGLLPDRQGLGVVAELDADLFEDGVGVGFDDLQGLFAQDLEDRDLALDEGSLGRMVAAARRAPGPGPAAMAPASPARRFVVFDRSARVAHSSFAPPAGQAWPRHNDTFDNWNCPRRSLSNARPRPPCSRHRTPAACDRLRKRLALSMMIANS